MTLLLYVDGCTSLFFHTYDNVVKEDLCTEFQEFYEN